MDHMDSERTIFEGFEGVHLVGDVWGDPGAWPVLFLHGGGQTRHAWGRTAEIVAKEGWRAITLDLRGHGDSDWAPKGDYSFTAFCADTVAVADELGKPPVLVGASLGGMTAMIAEGTSDRALSSGPGAGRHRPEHQCPRDRTDHELHALRPRRVRHPR